MGRTVERNDLCLLCVCLLGDEIGDKYGEQGDEHGVGGICNLIGMYDRCDGGV